MRADCPAGGRPAGGNCSRDCSMSARRHESADSGALRPCQSWPGWMATAQGLGAACIRRMTSETGANSRGPKNRLAQFLLGHAAINSEAKLGLCLSSFFSRRYDCAGSRPFCCQTRPRPETAGPHEPFCVAPSAFFFGRRNAAAGRGVFQMCFGFISGPSAGLFNLQCPAAPECRP